MVVTINTDASFSHYHEIGSYAFWIKCDEFNIGKSGLLRKRVSRPEIAEFRCVLNALHTLFIQKTTEKIGFIVVNTDCLNVIHLINNDKEAIQKYRLASWGRYLVQTYDSLRIKHKHLKTKIEFRHVKAHTDTDTGRNFINDWCDKEAKKHIEEYKHKNHLRFKKDKK